MTTQNPDNIHADNPALPRHASAQIAAAGGAIFGFSLRAQRTQHSQGATKAHRQ
ncbi:hypothetical protein IE4872_CH02447 [Rhizobium gallicum]|uniref:Uncharacterized protein n=1 Tax=Rhizobium gallicum TaxID=56730 RepID=A0A1L5NJH1_9HYPH|nr:hypothetical protein IE4872_CH02447 [Rhizobium gallicum]